MYGIAQSLRGSEMCVRVWFGHNYLGHLKGFLKENDPIKSLLRILVRLCLMIVYSCTIGEDSILEIFKWNRGRGRIHDEDDTPSAWTASEQSPEASDNNTRCSRKF
jgi:hypothetical protein